MNLRKFILAEVEKRHPASDKPLTKILEALDNISVLKKIEGEHICYTDKEGGSWIDWPIDAKFDYDWTILRDKTAVQMGNIKVHSLSFGHPMAGYSRVQRWDCINGFDTLVPDLHW